MEESLAQISEQLVALQRQVAALAAAAHARSRDTSETSGVAPGAGGSAGIRVALVPFARGPSESTDEDEAELRQMRPKIYPHSPRRRPDGLEALQWNAVEVLDKLKLDSFQGLYNLSALGLVFALAYITTRNVMDHGLRARLEDFTCAPLLRDSLWAALLVLLAGAWSFGALLLQRAFLSNWIALRTLVVLYVLLQAGLLGGPIFFYYHSPIGPLMSAYSLLVVLVLLLKIHSYLATNYALYRERLALPSSAVAARRRRTGDGDKDKDKDKDDATSGRLDDAQEPNGAEEGTSGGKGEKEGDGALKAGSGARRRRRHKGTRPASSPSSAPSAATSVASPSASATALSPAASSTVGARAGSRARMSDAEDDGPRAESVEGDSEEGDGGEDDEADASSSSSSSPAARRRRQRALLEFPNNVTFSDFAYFLFAPSLVYEPRFPRVKERRWGYIARKLLECLVCVGLQYLTLSQFMLPVLRGTKQNPFWFDLMKLGIPSLVLWLALFYTMFHCILNALAELLRFGDRMFYKEWWNATSLDVFWRDWNVPVHEWCLRHVYVEGIVYANMPKPVAMLSTFLLSAVFHELVFSVAFKTARPWFFLGMMLQIPLIFLSRLFRGTRRGNYLVWLSLFAGQPLLEILYFREWFTRYDEFFCVEG